MEQKDKDTWSTENPDLLTPSTGLEFSIEAFISMKRTYFTQSKEPQKPSAG